MHCCHTKTHFFWTGKGLEGGGKCCIVCKKTKTESRDERENWYPKMYLAPRFHSVLKKKLHFVPLSQAQQARKHLFSFSVRTFYPLKLFKRISGFPCDAIQSSSQGSLLSLREREGEKPGNKVKFNLFINRISWQSFFNATFKVNCRLFAVNKQLFRCLFLTSVFRRPFAVYIHMASCWFCVGSPKRYWWLWVMKLLFEKKYS